MILQFQQGKEGLSSFTGILVETVYIRKMLVYLVAVTFAVFILAFFPCAYYDDFREDIVL